jgi:hypothetical protein
LKLNQTVEEKWETDLNLKSVVLVKKKLYTEFTKDLAKQTREKEKGRKDLEELFLGA